MKSDRPLWLPLIMFRGFVSDLHLYIDDSAFGYFRWQLQCCVENRRLWPIKLGLCQQCPCTCLSPRPKAGTTEDGDVISVLNLMRGELTLARMLQLALVSLVGLLVLFSSFLASAAISLLQDWLLRSQSSSHALLASATALTLLQLGKRCLVHQVESILASLTSRPLISASALGPRVQKWCPSPTDRFYFQARRDGTSPLGLGLSEIVRAGSPQKWFRLLASVPRGNNYQRQPQVVLFPRAILQDPNDQFQLSECCRPLSRAAGRILLIRSRGYWGSNERYMGCRVHLQLASK